MMKPLIIRGIAWVLWSTVLASWFAHAVYAESAPELRALATQSAQLYQQGKFGEALALAESVLDAQERQLGGDHPDTLTSVNNLALLYDALGQYVKAELLYRRALETAERVLGKDHPHTLTSVSNLATLYQTLGQYNEAEPLYLRALSVSEQVLGRDHPDTLATCNNLAELYREKGRYNEAAPLYHRVLEALERVLGQEHPDTLTVVNNLALLYQAQGRLGEAESLYRRVLAARERLHGVDHPDTLLSIHNLAFLYQAQERYGEAEPLYQKVLTNSERMLGRDHPQTLLSINNLAVLYRYQKRYRDAEPLYVRAVESTERVFGKGHPRTLTSVNNLALLYHDQGRDGAAEQLLLRVLAGLERPLGDEHPQTISCLNVLATLYLTRSDWRRAVEFWRRGTAAISRRTMRGAVRTGAAMKEEYESEEYSEQFSGLVKVAYRLTPSDAEVDETFLAAQWVFRSQAARSLIQMAARISKGHGALADLARERQDLVAEWQKRDTWRDAAYGRNTDERNAKAEMENSGRLGVIETRIVEIDKRLTVEFPDYAVLANPTPLSLADLQTLLGADEALLLFLDTKERGPTPEETFIWVVTKTGIRLVRSELGTAGLAREVQALRCGLDAVAAKEAHCTELTNQTYTDEDEVSGKLPPFDYGRAHRLYLALFGQVGDLIKGKQLLLVPSGPLTQLPFQVLITASHDANRKPAWFIRDHALTVLPSVSSLMALRRVSHPSRASKPMIGFGNPLLDGQQNHRDQRYAAYFKKRAQLARDNQQCRATTFQRVAGLFNWHRGVTPEETNGGLANVDHIRMQTPLPETADELCAVASDVKADTADIHLGKGANEHDVKALSVSGQLARYRIVHFATHGALAGELKGTSEPGLILTPPANATEDDDGYLSASEIASLKLDADWVILSACNTAAGNATGAQALSGLARAFIYAQARALLVSHWAVDSEVTVKLISGAMRETSRDTKVGRAEALRRSMLALIDKGEDRQAHPAFWAPFVVVGEGAR